MTLKAVSRPFIGYLFAFVVLILSTLNLGNLLFILFRSGDFGINEVLSLLVSLLGIFAFILDKKGNSWASLLFIFWSLPQLFYFQLSSGFVFDLSQFVDFQLIKIGTQDSVTEIMTGILVGKLNLLAIIMFGIAMFRIENAYYFGVYTISSVDKFDHETFHGRFVKRFAMGPNKTLLVLQNLNDDKEFLAVQIKNEESLRFTKSDKKYLICHIKESDIKKSKFDSHELIKLGHVHIVRTSNYKLKKGQFERMLIWN